MLKGKNVVLGVTAGIAAYKSCELISRLTKQHCNVDVILTENAANFITPLTLQTLSKNKVITEDFSVLKENEQWDIRHISLAKKADLLVVAPATADVIAKLAQGLADDMLTTTALATKAKLLICPAMNTAMYNNPLNKEHMAKLQAMGHIIVAAESGVLACGDTGDGRLASIDVIMDSIIKQLLPVQDLAGKRVLITAGATIEPIDAVRYITNHSSGKMGVALAEAAIARGAQVSFVYGNVSVPLPQYLTEAIHVTTTRDMLEETQRLAQNCDFVIMSAAPSDYRPLNYTERKIKSETLTLQLTKNPDIAKTLGTAPHGFKLVIFAAETQDLLNYAVGKLQSKNADMVVANDVTQQGAGFNSDTNIVTIIKRDGMQKAYPQLPKTEVAHVILDNMVAL